MTTREYLVAGLDAITKTYNQLMEEIEALEGKQAEIEERLGVARYWRDHLAIAGSDLKLVTDDMLNRTVKVAQSLKP